jgi:hypothetical protein
MPEYDTIMTTWEQVVITVTMGMLVTFSIPTQQKQHVGEESEVDANPGLDSITA